MSASAVVRPGREAPPRMASWEAERRSYRPDPPEQFNAVVDILDRWADAEPEAVALVSLDAAGELAAQDSVADLVRASRRMGGALLGAGLAPGDRLLVMLPRVAAWYTAMLGAMRVGIVPVPTPNLSTPRDLGYRLTASRALGAITDEAGAAKLAELTDGVASRMRLRARWAPGAPARPGWLDLDELLDQVDAGATSEATTRRDDPLLMFFTSGTVSHAKMVVHDHSYALGHVATARFWHDLRAGDLHWTIADTGWAKAAWGGLFGQWHERATVLQAALDRPQPELILGILARWGVTSFCAPPTLYRSLVQADVASYDLGALRHCTSAGEPLNPEVIRAWSDATGGLTIYDGYGQSESTVLVANYRALPVRPGSMGKPVPGYDVGVVDEHGAPAASGSVGSLAVSIAPRWPVGLFRGYEGVVPDDGSPFCDGWYHTGDKAYADADGYLWFEGRSDDVITSSAYRIGPFEVESALIEHPAVVEAAVVGRDDPQRTQVVCACVVLATGWEPSPALATELQDHVKRVTAPYKYPREVIFVDELPKTISGKIRRSELRERMRQGKL